MSDTSACSGQLTSLESAKVPGGVHRLGPVYLMCSSYSLLVFETDWRDGFLIQNFTTPT